MKATKEKMFPQPTKIGTKIYAYSKYEDYKEDSRNVYEIVHLNLEEEEELLKCLILDNCSEKIAKLRLYKEVNNVTDIFDTGAEAGQKRLKQGFNK